MTATLSLAFCSIFLTVSIFGQSFQSKNTNPNQFKSLASFDEFISWESNQKKTAFTYPFVYVNEIGCSNNSRNDKRFAKNISVNEMVLCRDALKRVSDGLNSHYWSPELAIERRETGSVFLTEKVRIYSMKNGDSKRFLEATQAVAENRK